MKLKLYFFLLSCLPLMLSAQNTVGVLTHEAGSLQDGYNLYYPHNQANAYLLDNCGRIINTWTDAATYRPGNTVYLMPNGNLVKAKRNVSVQGDAIWAGGGGGIVEILDWDNNLLWSYHLNDSLNRLHHDIAPMKNGNILMLAWEKKSRAEAIAAGRDTSQLVEDELWPERVIEVKPIGTDSFQIVWEWHVWDHLVQDFDTAKANFGDPAAKPELIDLNYIGSSEGEADWQHANSIDFDEDLNQILISVPTFNEIWIIDHSTTTAQAATHKGGFGGIGGDLMYRWGNPLAHSSGDSSDMQLNFQHDAHWIDIALPSSHPDHGKIMVYNNRIGGNYSAVNIIRPLFDTYEWEYFAGTNNLFAPDDYEWTYTAPTPTDMFSTGLSGAQRLENGNTLICSGRQGWAFEIDDSSKIVWEYVNPLVQGSPVTNGDAVLPGSNLNFRFTRYPYGYEAFIGKSLTPGAFIEIDPDTTLCPATVSIDPEKALPIVKIYPNPAQKLVYLEREDSKHTLIELYDFAGRKMKEQYARERKVSINLDGLSPGVYLIRMDQVSVGKVMVK